MLRKLDSCRGCPLYGDGWGFVPASGSGTNKVLIVGEAAGEQEAKEGLPFVGAAGFYLSRLLKRAGLPRDGFRIHNVLSCRPPDNKLAGAWYEAQAVSHCYPNLAQTIEEMRPNVIVAMGGSALRRLTGFSEITRYRGYVIRGDGCWIVPTFHPSFLLPRKGQANTSRFVGSVIRDLRKAVRIAQEGFRRDDAVYLCDPPPLEAMAFAEEYEKALEADPDTYLSFDIETPYKLKVKDEEELNRDNEEEEETDEEEGRPREERPPDDPIIRISFCFRPRYAMSIPWAGPWMDVIRRVLGSSGRKVGWNSTAFDLPVIRANGCEVKGHCFDGMWAWHLLQSALPRGLESVASFFADHILPWKHLSQSEPAWYNACDADAALCNMIGIEKELRENGQWEIFLRHSVELDAILYRVGRINGVNIDRAAQDELRKFLEERKDDVLTKSQDVVPTVVRPTKVYKKFREGAEIVEVPGKVKRCSLCGMTGVTKTTHMKGPCKKGELLVVDGIVNNYVERLDFNPNSRMQMMEYCRWANHPIGRDRKTGKPALGKKHLQRLAKKYGDKHPIYHLSLDIRAISKSLGTYVVGFAPDNRGLIYTYYTHAPATPRLSSRNVNLQNVSHRGSAPYAREIRRTIVPPRGCCFVEADSSAIEAVMTGYFMQDEEYIKMAHRGIHDYLTCMKLGLDFWKEDIGKLKKDRKYKDLRDIFKIVVHGTSYGMTPGLMCLEHPEVFPTEKSAREAQGFFLECVPNLPKWHHEIRMFAHKTSYLVNPWGYRTYYYNVFNKDRDGRISLGEDGKSCIAALPQGSAACFMMDNAILIYRELEKINGCDWIPANYLCHDSYCIAPPYSERATVAKILEDILTRPIPEMGGLRVGCEIGTGDNWAEIELMKKVEVA